MGSVIFLEHLCGGMGTAAFVTLLMTLCNRSFSATQFALLSAFSAVGHIYVGPIAGWFVETNGWPLFYLFSIAAALPSLLLLGICRKTLKYTQNTGNFIPREAFPRAYSWTLQLLTLGCTLLGLWLLLLIADNMDWLQVPGLAERMLQIGAASSLMGILMGSLFGLFSITPHAGMMSRVDVHAGPAKNLRARIY